MLDIGTYTAVEIIELLQRLDNDTEWTTIDEFWDTWNPRIVGNDRIRKLALTAILGARRAG